MNALRESRGAAARAEEERNHEREEEVLRAAAADAKLAEVQKMLDEQGAELEAALNEYHKRRARDAARDEEREKERSEYLAAVTRAAEAEAARERERERIVQVSREKEAVVADRDRLAAELDLHRKSSEQAQSLRTMERKVLDSELHSLHVREEQLRVEMVK